jgi:hypothetical protein
MSRILTTLLCVVLVAQLNRLAAQQRPEPAAEPASKEENGGLEESAPAREEELAETSQRTSLNLLGQVAASSGEARRNENVSVTLIDNNVLKELNQRMGTTASIFQQFEADRSYFGKEYGGSPAAPLHIAPAVVQGLHTELYWSHSNSIFTARSFFQVGAVQPARANDYGVSVSSRLWRDASLTFSAGQNKLRGQVNGNILVPAANERTPTTSDPHAIAIIQGLLNAFPAELPNRTDINPRALNTNAPQNINDDRVSATLDQGLSTNDRVTLRYGLTMQNVEAFQLFGGQNPDTTTKNHDARVTWKRTFTPATIAEFSIGFSRVGSLIVPDETAPEHDFLFQRILESVGPGNNVPLDRAQNTFRYAARVRRTGHAHTVTAGFDVARRQINGSESNDHRGTYQFRRDFGRDLIGNLLAGTPSVYRQAFGSAHAGFRAWSPSIYAGDEWKATGGLSLSLGMRYEFAPRPHEVNGLHPVAYDCDCNNIAPRFAFAYKAGGLGVLRGVYGLQFGEIFAVTYMQSRFNPPAVLSLNITAPDLVNPLRGLTGGIGTDTRTDFFRVDPDLATPYSHQYNFTWELRPFGSWVLDLGYVGSRTHKLLTAWYTNRARQVPGVDPNTQNINERRPNSRYSDVLYTLNGSRAYYDAGRVTLRVPRWAGVSMEASYWWSKAIDLGGDYTNTAFGRDARQFRSPSEFHVHQRMRGLSNFDQPHAAIWNIVYETPKWPGVGRLGSMLGSWQLAGVLLLKSGTPFGVETGSDAPGFGNVDGVSDDRPVVADPSVLGRTIDHPDRSPAQLPASAFRFAPITELSGNLGRNTFRKDGIANVNASLSRRFTLRGDTTLQVRAESLNFTNHPQFEAPGDRLSEGNFGEITNTLNDGRTFRFSLRVTF